MAFKVTLSTSKHIDPPTSLKLTLPSKWLEQPALKLKTTFVENYNKKNAAATPLVLDELHLERKNDMVMDDELIGKVFKNGDEILICPGPAVAVDVKTDEEVEDEDSTKKQQQQQQHDNDEDGEEEDVTTKAGIEKAKQKAAAKHAFDYSKWNKLDLSDDDAADCHPNIELASWKRIKAQQRRERREKEEEEIRSMQEKIEKHQQALDAYLQANDTPKESEVTALRGKVEKAKEKLAAFQNSRKWVADEVCEPKLDRTIINNKKEEIIAPVIKPKKAPTTIGPTPDEDFSDYDSYVDKYEGLLREFVKIDNNREKTQEFMLRNPQILHTHADGFLLLLCLDVAMRLEAKGGDRKELTRVVRQHLMLNYVLELAKVTKCVDNREAVQPFFFKTGKHSKEQQQEFEVEMQAFIERIQKRAKEKLGKGEKSPLDRRAAKEEDNLDDYEKAELGPGGLDPTEVLQSLPEEMQKCFIERDVGKLKAILEAMDKKEANYHLQRCIDAGLWTVPPGANDDGEDGEDEDEGEGGKQ